MPVINIPKILREKLTDEGVDALVALLNQTEEKAREVIIRFSEEKYERRLTEVSSILEQKIGKVETGLKLEIAAVKSALEEKIAALEVKITNVPANLIKWMFIFWVGQFASITAVLFLFFKK